MDTALVVVILVGLLIQVQADCNYNSPGGDSMVDIHVQKWISKERCDISSPGMLALELLSSKTAKFTVNDAFSESKRKAAMKEPSLYSDSETERIRDRVLADACDFKSAYVCRRDERSRLGQVFRMCGGSLKAYDHAGLPGFRDENLQQFFNTTIVYVRTYSWNGQKSTDPNKQYKGASGSAYSDLFIRLVPQRYREALKDSDFPVSIDGTTDNRKNKEAATKCWLIARAADPTADITKYAKDGFSKVSDDVVEKIFIGLLAGSVADRVLTEHAIKDLSNRKSASSKLTGWKKLGKKIKKLRDLPLCMDPLSSKIAEFKAECRLTNIALGDEDVNVSEIIGALTKSDQTPSQVVAIPGNPPAISDPHAHLHPMISVDPVPSKFHQTSSHVVQLPHHPVLPSFPLPQPRPMTYMTSAFPHPQTFVQTSTTARPFTAFQKEATKYASKGTGSNQKSEPIVAGMQIEPEPVLLASYNVGAGAPAYQASSNLAPSMTRLNSGDAPQMIRMPSAAPGR